MDNNEFDAILRERGWYYDNGACHDSQAWDYYIDSNCGSPDGYFAILSHKGEGRLLLTKGTASRNVEIWSGPLANENDVDALMAFIRSQNEKRES